MLLVLMWCVMCGEWILSGEGSFSGSQALWCKHLTDLHPTTHQWDLLNALQWLASIHTCEQLLLVCEQTHVNNLCTKHVHISLRSTQAMCWHLGIAFGISRLWCKSVFKCSNTQVLTDSLQQLHSTTHCQIYNTLLQLKPCTIIQCVVLLLLQRCFSHCICVCV